MYNRHIKRYRRPKRIHNITYRIRTGHSKFYIIVGYIKQGKPFEVFIVPAENERDSKPDPCEQAWADVLARSISIGLQYGVPVEEYIKQLRGTTCIPGSDHDRGRMVKSPADGVALILEDYIKEAVHDPS